ncbi:MULTISPECIES: hypothetical protein [Streptomyces]
MAESRTGTGAVPGDVPSRSVSGDTSRAAAAAIAVSYRHRVGNASHRSESGIRR